MLHTKPFVTTVELIETRDREAIVYYGSPGVPTIVPLARVDMEPLPAGSGKSFLLTTDRETAKEIGFLV